MQRPSLSTFQPIGNKPTGSHIVFHHCRDFSLTSAGGSRTLSSPCIANDWPRLDHSYPTGSPRTCLQHLPELREISLCDMALPPDKKAPCACLSLWRRDAGLEKGRKKVAHPYGCGLAILYSLPIVAQALARAIFMQVGHTNLIVIRRYGLDRAGLSFIIA